MKRFLIPTDFSPAAENAFKYANKLAAIDGSALKAFHVFHPEVDPSYPYIANSATDLLPIREEMLNSFVTKASIDTAGMVMTQTKVEQEVSIGYATDEIVRASREEDVDLIIMGTVGQNSFLNRMLGSVSSYVAQRAHCPTLLIPEKASFKDLKNVVYASNHKAADEVMLQQFLNFAGPFNPNIHFVHVEQERGFAYNVKDIKFEQIVRENAPDLGFQLVSLQSDNIKDGLNEYIAENEIDLLVMATEHRSFFDNLFHKSITRKMALYAEIPVLIMHFDDVA